MRVQELALPNQVADGDFNGWLREAMASRRMSQRVLAMRTGVHHSTISRLIKGNRGPSLATAVAILRVLAAPALIVGWSVEGLERSREADISPEAA